MRIIYSLSGLIASDFNNNSRKARKLHFKNDLFNAFSEVPVQQGTENQLLTTTANLRRVEAIWYEVGLRE